MLEAPGAEAVEEELEAVEEERAAARVDQPQGGASSPNGEEPDEPQMQPIFTGVHGVGTRYAGRIGRHAIAYGAGAIVTSLSGLVSIVVFTRFLDPSEFGRMAVLVTAATVATLVSSLTILPGTMRRVHGASGDVDAGDISEENPDAVTSDDPRLALSTGFAMVTAIGVVLLVTSWALRAQVAGLFGSAGDGTLVVLAIGAGVVGAMVRFCQYILRLQLRSSAYLAVSLVCAFGSIALPIPLLIAGFGIGAVLAGLIVGNVLAAAVSMYLLAGEFRLAVSSREAKAILSGGVVYLPLIAAFQGVHLGDTLLVAGLGSFSQTGMYRVAQQIALPVSFGTSVFQQAWGPLKKDMTHAAVDRVDDSRAYVARLFTYYALFVTALTLTVAALADPLVRLASSQFGEAAALVPLTTLSVAGHGWFIFSYRNAHLPRQMLWFIGLAIFAAVGFIALSVVLIPPLGAVGAPLGAIVAWSIATLTMLVANQLIGKPIPFEYRRLLTLAVLALSAWLLARWVLPDTAWGTVAKLALLLVWAGALLLARVVPVSDLHAAGRFLSDASGIDSRRQLRARLTALDGTDAVLVDEVVRRKRPPREVAERTGLSEEEVMANTVHVLRKAAGGGDAKETDPELGTLLFLPMFRTERDHALMDMVNNGADPIDVDLIKRAVVAASSQRSRGLRRLGRRATSAATPESG